MSITINIDSLLRFYDEKPKGENRGPTVSAITGLIGEDLILGLLKHYFENRDKSFEILSGEPQGTKKLCGHQKKLDAWILIDDKELYQVEIKNWSAWSKDGQPVDEKKLGAAGLNNQKNYLNTRNTKDAERVWKVLRLMQFPEDKENEDFILKPLLAFWCPISPATIDEPFREFSIEDFQESIAAAGFPKDFEKVSEKVSIFSASLYLRKMHAENTLSIDIDMPRIHERLKWIHQLLPKSLEPLLLK